MSSNNQNQRINFASIKNPMQYPDFLEVQLKSFQDFYIKLTNTKYSIQMSSNNQNQRINFASIKNPMQYPDFLEVQLKSFQDFVQLDTPPENELTLLLLRIRCSIRISWKCN